LSILQNPHLGVLGCKILCDPKSPIQAPVLNYQDFYRVRLPICKFKYLLERLRQAGLFVMSWDNE
jgi:hypothetical protein